MRTIHRNLFMSRGGKGGGQKVGREGGREEGREGGRKEGRERKKREENVREIMKCNQYTKNRSPWRPTIRGISCESPEYDKHIVHIQLPHNFISFLLWWRHCLATQGTAVKRWQVNGMENIYKYASELASFPGCAHVAWEWGYTDVDQWKHGISLIRRCGYNFFFFLLAFVWLLFKGSV